jgi:hypothetical protein
MRKKMMSMLLTLLFAYFAFLISASLDFYIARIVGMSQGYNRKSSSGQQ